MSTGSSTARTLLEWYHAHQRPLPWRATTDPYAIWLSEVILQQTRVEQGTAYWKRFMARYPTVHHLARAPEAEVLKLWQGLGYYSRARNLLIAATQVVEQHGGQFPTDLTELRQLKGVGEYTAAAIASIAFGARAAVVDGNVFRVLTRLYDVPEPIDATPGKRLIKELADRFLHPDQPGDHNQAMMELGATVCLPRNPLCHACPLSAGCLALARGTVALRPVKARRTKVRDRHFNYLDIELADGRVLQCRPAGDIWQGLYEPPLIETPRTIGPKALHKELQALAPGKWRIHARTSPTVHILSHQRIHAIFWKLSPPENLAHPSQWMSVPARALERHAVPRLVERWLNGELPFEAV